MTKSSIEIIERFLKLSEDIRQHAGGRVEHLDHFLASANDAKQELSTDSKLSICDLDRTDPTTFGKMVVLSHFLLTAYIFFGLNKSHVEPTLVYETISDIECTMTEIQHCVLHIKNGLQRL